MSKPKKVWLSRDKLDDWDWDGGFEGDYSLFETKPKKDTEGVFVSAGKLDALIKSCCEKDFEGVTGFALKPGQCKRVTIEIKLV